jgi:hypothetical protein
MSFLSAFKRAIVGIEIKDSYPPAADPPEPAAELLDEEPPMDEGPAEPEPPAPRG